MAVNVNEEQMKLVFELEMEMMADMYNRMASSCQKKCIPPRYNDSELNKGEAVCLDRCVAKFLEVHDQVVIFLFLSPSLSIYFSLLFLSLSSLLSTLSFSLFPSLYSLFLSFSLSPFLSLPFLSLSFLSSLLSTLSFSLFPSLYSFFLSLPFSLLFLSLSSLLSTLSFSLFPSLHSFFPSFYLPHLVLSLSLSFYLLLSFCLSLSLFSF
ncbi:TIM10 [Acanthosepion pharaonis]|uniref:TIM10 n=1 Tax=Acanthosepion pharaonis TaxID=158019 RepID=A0A812CSQ8_ACAPH|nr:TIM10 [Sepia pharaonis]